MLSTRRQIRVDKVLDHENFIDSGTDIALLRLGKKGLIGDFLFSTNPFNNQLSEERVDLSVFSPVCLPGIDESFVDQNGTVYGKQRQPMQMLNPDLLASQSDAHTIAPHRDPIPSIPNPLIAPERKMDRQSKIKMQV